MEPGRSRVKLAILLGTATAVINADVSGLVSGVTQAEGALNRLGTATGQADKSRQMLGAGMLGLGGAIAGGFGIGINAAANFEQGMSGVAAAMGGVGTASGITEQQFTSLSDEAMRIGQVTSKSATEAAMAMELMSKAGVDIETVLNGGAQAAVNISEATSEGLEQSASTMASLLQLFESTGISADHMADVIVNGMNASDATMSEFQTGIARLAPTIKGTSMSMEEAAASIAFFNAQGFSAAEVGTSLNAAFLRLANPVKGTTDGIAELAAVSGVTIDAFDDLSGQFVGFPALFDQVAAATKGMTEEQQAYFLSTIFGSDALDVMTLGAQQGGDALTELTGKMAASGTAAEASKTRMDNFKGAIEQLRGTVETLLIAFFTGLLPGLKLLTRGLTSFLNIFLKIPARMRNVIVGFTALAGVVAAGVGAFALFGPQIALVGAVLGGLALPFAGLIAAGAGLYLAWRTNFLGIRDAVDNAIEPIRRFVEIFKASFANLQASEQTIQTWGSALGGAVGYGNRFSNVLAAIGMALRGMTGGRDIGWINAIAGGLDRAAGFVGRFKDAWDSLAPAIDGAKYFAAWEGLDFATPNAGLNLLQRAMGALDIATGGAITRLREMSAIDIAISIGSWVISAAIDLGTAVYEWIRDTALPAVASAAVTVASVAVSIADWLVSTTKSLGTAVLDWITGTALPTISRAAREIGSFAVSIGGWIVTTAKNLGSAVLEWITGTALPTIGRTAQDIGDFAVKIGGWIVTSAKSLAGDVLTWIRDTALPTIGRTAQDIGTFAVSIAGWIVTSTVSLGGKVLEWITGTALPTIGRTARDIGSFAVRITDWLVTSTVSLGGKVLTWIRDTALPTIGRTAQDIGSFAVRIGDWIVTSTASLGSKVLEWIKGTAIPTISRIAQDIGTFAVKIADWAVTSVVSLAGKVTGWITGTAIPTIVRIAQDIGTFALEIRDWIVTSGVKIGERVWSWITTAVATISRVAFDIGTFAIKISDWVKSGWADLVSWVTSEVELAWTGNADAPAGIGIVSVKIAEFDATLDVGALDTAINAAFTAETSRTGGDFANARAAGESKGKGAWDAFSAGFSQIFGGGGSGGGGGENSQRTQSGLGAMSKDVTETINGFIEGIFTGIGDDIPEIPPYDFSQKFDNMFSGLGDDLQSLSDDIVADLDLAAAALGVKWTAFKEDIGDLLGVFEMPDITWPSWDVSLDDIPFVTDAKALFGSIKDFFADPWGGAISIPVPTINWPDMPEPPGWVKDIMDGKIPGTGKTDKEILAALGPKGGGGGKDTGDLQSWRGVGGQTAGMGMAGPAMKFPAPDTTALMAALASVKTAFASTQTSVGLSTTGLRAKVAMDIGGIPPAVGPPVAAVKLALVTGFSGMATRAGIDFAAIKTAASTNIGGLPAVVTMPVALTRAALTTGLAGMSASAGINFAAVKSAASLNIGGLPGVVTVPVALTKSAIALGLSGMAAGAGTNFAAVKSAASLNIGGLPTVVATPVALTRTALTTGLAGMAASAGINFAAVKTAASTNIGGLPGVVTPAVQGVKAVFSSGLAGLAGTTAINFGAVKASATTQTSAMATNVISAVGRMRTSVTSGLSGMSGSAGVSVGGMATRVATAAAGMGSRVTTAVSTMRGSAITNLNAMASGAAGAGTRMSGALTTAASTALTGVRGKISQIPGVIQSFSGAAGSAAAALGTNAGNSLVNALSAQIARVRAVASQLAEAAAGALRSALGINSPSRVTTEIGAQAGTGFAIGLQNLAGNVWAASNGVARSAISGMQGVNPLGSGQGIGGNMSAGVAGGILGRRAAVTGAAISVVHAALGAAKAAAGINSPAKAWVPPGGSMMDGVANGITARRGAVISAAVNVVKAAQAAAQAQAARMSIAPPAMRSATPKSAAPKGGGRDYNYFKAMFSPDAYSKGKPDLDWGNDYLRSVGDKARPLMMAIGKDVANGFYSGVNRYSGLGSTATVNMMLNARDSAKRAMGIRSPSTVMATIGRQVGAGFAKGITSQITGVQKATKALTKAGTPVLAKAGGKPSPYADLFRDRKRLSATDYSVRNGRFTEHYGTGMTSNSTTVINNNTTVNNPTLEEQTWLDHQRMAQQGQQAAATVQRGQSRTMARTGQRGPVRMG